MLRLYKALPTLHGFLGSNLQTKPFRNFSCSATNWKKFSFSELDPDTQVLLISPKDASETQMMYSEVLEKVPIFPNWKKSFFQIEDFLTVSGWEQKTGEDPENED